jgi:HEAT repeat protein
LLTGDSDPWVRQEAATALGAARGGEARARLLEAADVDPEAKVRAASLVALARYGPDRMLAASADAVFEQGYSYATMAAAAVLYVSADPRGAFDWLEPRLARHSPHDALCQALVGVLALVDDPRVYEVCRGLAADPARSPTARAAAVARLAALHEKPIDTARFIGGLLAERDTRLQGACVNALADLDNPESLRFLRTFYTDAPSGDQRRVIEAAFAPEP